MPQVRVKEVRLSELHLPEIKREDIVRSLSEIHLPDLDLPGAVSKIEWPKIDLSSVDVGKAVAGAAAAAHIGRRAHRPRWPLAVGGLIVAGLAGWAILNHEVLRARLARGARAIRERVSAVRTNRYDRREIDPDHPIAFSAAETAPIEASPFTDNTTSKDTIIDEPWQRAARAHAEARSTTEPEERAALLAQASRAEVEVTRATDDGDAAEAMHQEYAP